MFLNNRNINFFMLGIIILIFPITLGNSFYGYNNRYNINIEYEQHGSLLTIEGTFINNSLFEENVFYRLTIKKKGKSNNSSTNQSGYAKIPINSKIILSKSSVDLHNDALYTIHLTVQSNKIILADKEIKLKGSEIQKH